MLIILFFLSALLTGLVRYYSLANQVMDIPNSRSSHTIPTPRGGGMAFVCIFLFYTLYLGVTGQAALSTCLGFLISGLMVAALGFIDDHHPIPAKWRLLGHFIAAGFALYCLGGIPSSLISWQFPFTTLLLSALTLFFLVWLLNLYNFMDGINGLAAIEGITVCLGAIFIYSVDGYTSLALFPLILTVVLVGFLFWNFPIARIFMGDAGSGFLGLIIGLFAIQSAHTRTEFFWSWVILLGVFIVDASVTLLRRLITGQRLTEGHCTHAYQCAANRFQSHVPVTVAVFLMNVGLLLPVAYLVGYGRLNPVIGIVIAYTPLVFLVVYFQQNVFNHLHPKKASAS